MNKRKNMAAPLLIGLMIGLFVLFLAWAGNRAATLGTRISDREYYTKGLKYNNTLVEKRAAKVLGWTLAVRLEGRDLVLTLTDGRQHPVEGASGSLRLARRSMAPEIFPLTESGSGHYRMRLPDDLKGELRAEVQFEHDSALLNRQLLLSLQ